MYLLRQLMSYRLVIQIMCDTLYYKGVPNLKITIHIDEAINETEINIHCNQLTPDIENILTTLRMMNQQMLVTKEDVNYLLDVNNISYIEALERKTFVYTEDNIYESKLKLYEMEQRLYQSGFLRVSKSCLVHLKYIQSIRKDVDRRLRLTLKNGEQLIVSRQYADGIKKRLGVK